MKLIDLWFGINRREKIVYNGAGSACVVMALYLHCLGNKYDAGLSRKVAVTITNDPRFLDDKIMILDAVAYITEKFNFIEFDKLNSYEKKRMILDTLQKAILRIAEEYNWSTTELHDAYNCCIERKLIFEWYMEKGKYFLSPDRKYYSRLFGSMDSDKVEFFTVFYNKKKEEIKRVKILEENPCLYEIGDMGWVKDDSLTFRVNHGFKKNIFWDAQLAL